MDAEKIKALSKTRRLFVRFGAILALGVVVAGAAVMIRRESEHRIVID